MLKKDKPVKRYSESFKLKVLSELENGEKTKAVSTMKNLSIKRSMIYNAKPLIFQKAKELERT
jgi:hypothetical protein